MYSKFAFLVKIVVFWPLESEWARLLLLGGRSTKIKRELLCAHYVPCLYFRQPENQFPKQEIATSPSYEPDLMGLCIQGILVITIFFKNF